MIATDILNIFDLDNQIYNIQGSFRYRFFDPIEQIDEQNRFKLRDDPRGTPRYVRLDWTSKGVPRVDIGLGNRPSFRLEHKNNFFFASDLCPTYCILTTDETNLIQNQSHVISDSTTGSKLDYLLKTIASDEYTENIENNIDSHRSKIPTVDRTTNRPVTQTTISRADLQQPDIKIRARNVNHILKSAAYSPLSRGIYDNVLQKANIIDERFKNRTEPDARRLTTLHDTIKRKIANTNSFPSVSRTNKPDGYLENWTPVGFVISKYRMENGAEKYMYARFVTNEFFEDPFVAYGKTYRYQIRPVFGKYHDDQSEKVVLIGTEESVMIDIECVENKIPSPPKNPKFEYALNGNIRVSWQRPESFIEDRGLVDTDDIKGYQLFVRNSLMEPYRLYRYFTFNNTVPETLRMKAFETISDDYIISSEYTVSSALKADDIPKFFEFKEYTVPIRANVDYYFALCSIDAHGNSSNYSAQYKVRRNNVTGEVDIHLVCPVGAPKQYPNLLIPGKLVQPAMKVSGYKFMDTYYCPDSRVSIPNIGSESVNIQLFELETQVEKNITITMKEIPNSSN